MAAAQINDCICYSADYPHLHPLRTHHEEAREMKVAKQVRIEPCGEVSAPPGRWALIHGFIAGFGFGWLSLFINTIAAPAMPSPWIGFLPGFFYGAGTMITLVIIGVLFGTFLHWTGYLTIQEIQWIGGEIGEGTLLGEEFFPASPELPISLAWIVIFPWTWVYDYRPFNDHRGHPLLFLSLRGGQGR